MYCLQVVKMQWLSVARQTRCGQADHVWNASKARGRPFSSVKLSAQQVG